ncbi:class I SAM-dependent methyltransferase [Candidatus Pelagibacter sp.]|jgi:2-polyprenyl-3-methyl-5-hydroxy-6-metoxy-1,4-benzoquinol methylase|nr:class I SAM-dependent methyltransferase [Candidatus Pelagibacter sp.]
MYIFKYFSRLDTVTIAKIINKKKINVLDYGCGVGTWTKKDLINKSFNKITLYDKNQKLYNYLKKKYKSRKVLINFNKNKVLENNKNYDLVVLSSVAQYLSKNELRKILNKLKNRSKKTVYLIIDIPKFPNYIEFILLPFFNIKRFFFSISLIFNAEYKKIKIYNHNYKSYKFLKKQYKIKKISNLYDLKFLRYTLMIEAK